MSHQSQTVLRGAWGRDTKPGGDRRQGETEQKHKAGGKQSRAPSQAEELQKHAGKVWGSPFLCPLGLDSHSQTGLGVPPHWHLTWPFFNQLQAKGQDCPPRALYSFLNSIPQTGALRPHSSTQVHSQVEC